jgi:hypothetical protein
MLWLVFGLTAALLTAGVPLSFNILKGKDLDAKVTQRDVELSNRAMRTRLQEFYNYFIHVFGHVCFFINQLYFTQYLVIFTLLCLLPFLINIFSNAFIGLLNRR